MPDGMPRANCGRTRDQASCRSRLWRHRRLEQNSEQRGNEQRHADASDASLPAEPVEELAEDRGAHEFRRRNRRLNRDRSPSPVRACRAADKAGGGGLREEGADADEHHAGQERGKAYDNINGRPRAATASEPQKVARVPKRSTARPASGVVAIDGRNTK